jgi:MFS family permease
MTSSETDQTAIAAKPSAKAGVPKMALSEWTVLGAAVLAPATLAIMVPLSHYCILSFMSEFDATRATVMFYLALGVVGQNLLAPFVGRLLTKVAPWMVMLAGAVLASAGLFVCSMAPSLIVVAVGFFVTLAVGCTLAGSLGSYGPLASQAIIARQFPRVMGRAVATQHFVASLMSISLPLVVAPFLTAHGWRVTLSTAAFIVLVYTSAMVLGFLRKTGTASVMIDASQVHATSDQAEAPTTHQILMSPNFWILLLALEPIALVVGGIAPNLVPFYDDRGVSLDEAKYTLSMLAAASGVGTLLAGFVVDRIGPWIYMTVIAVVSVLSMGALSANLGDPAIPFIALIIAVSGMGATLIVAISRLFGRAAAAPVLGLLAPFMMASAFAGAFTGWLRDELGSYQAVFAIMAAVLLVSLVASVLLFRAKGANAQSV